MNGDNVVTCVYCGQAYPEGTPTHGATILTEHIKLCEKHPMRKAEAVSLKLWSALVALVGSDGVEELQAMKLFLLGARTALANNPEELKMVEASIKAIDVLIETSQQVG